MLHPLLRTLGVALAAALFAAPVIAADPPAHTTGTTGTQVAPPPHSGDIVPKGGSADLISAVWVVIIFLLLLAILYPTAWKNVLAGLKAREQRIREDIASAEAARAKAEATLREYNQQLSTAAEQARQTIAAAAAEAERVAASIRARGENEAQESKERALREIDAARKQALAEIYDQTAALATSVAEKIIRRSLNADDQRDLVARSLDELQTIGDRN